MTRYVEIRFRPQDRRTYTYHVEDEPMLAAGDWVEIDARGSPRVVEVVSVTDEAPPYATKPILRVVPPEPATPDDPISDVGAGDG